MVERGIGRGLAAIFPAVAGEQGLQRIAVDAVSPNPRQPRGSVDAGLDELGESIKSRGVLQPVLVRPLAGGKYELIAGERRWRAARLAGLEEIPALVRSSEGAELLELALVENMARRDLNPIEAAHACAALVEELDLTKEEVGRRVGRSRVAISNLIRLLDLPDEVLTMLRTGELTEGHGRALLQARSAREQRALAKEVCDRGLSVRETEAAARSAATEPSRLHAADGTSSMPSVHPDAEQARQDAEDELTAALGCEVHIRLKRSGGRIEIPFDDLSEAHELARRLAGRLAA